MRQELIGVVLAAALIGGLFFAATHRAEPAGPAQIGNLAAREAAARSAAATIKPGFIGRKRIGAWDLVCTASPVMISVTKPPAAKPKVATHKPPLPLSLDGGEKGKAAAPAAAAGTSAPTKQELSLGRCRATQAFWHKGAAKREVALSVNLRIVGVAPGRVGLFVRLPAKAAKKGQALQVRLGKSNVRMPASFKIPVISCEGAGCLAVAVLDASGARLLQTSSAAELLLPARSDGRRAGVRVAVAGLASALDAIRRAQS